MNAPLEFSVTYIRMFPVGNVPKVSVPLESNITCIGDIPKLSVPIESSVTYIKDIFDQGCSKVSSIFSATSIVR